MNKSDQRISETNKDKSSFRVDALKQNYWAFISYRHLDNQAYGRNWASWLHQSIETYDIPEELVGKENELGIRIPEVLFPIFRDEEELPADADLASSVAAALERSRYLIVICSPRSVESEYVCQEIQFFKKLGRSDRILSMLIDGEPNASWDEGKLRAGFSPDRECLPLPLRHPVDIDGKLDTTKRTEPIAADFRIPGGHQGWTTAAAYKEALETENKHSKPEIDQKVNDYQKQLEHSVRKILSGVLGIPLNSLTQRDKAYQLEKSRRQAIALRRWLAAMTALALVAIFAGLIAMWQRGVAIQNAQTAETNEVKARKQSALAAIARDEAKEETRRAYANYYATQLNLIQMDWESGEVDRLRDRLQQSCPRNTGGEDYRGFEWYYWNRFATPESFSLKPSGNFLLDNPGFNCVAYSPDGMRVAGGGEFGCRIWSTVTGKEVVTIDKNITRSVSYSPDGTRIATVTGSGLIQIWSAHDGQKIRELDFESKGVLTAVKFSPDGQLLAVNESEQVTVWKALDGQRLFALKSPELADGAAVTASLDSGISFSPNGDRLAKANVDNTVTVWDLKTQKKLLTFQEHSAIVLDVAFSPDGNRIASASHDNSIMIWDSRSGRMLQQWRGHYLGIFSVMFDPDGRQIASSDGAGNVRIWNSFSGKLLLNLQGHSSIVDSLAFSPTGKQLATASRDGTLRLWNPVSESELATMTGHANQVFCVDFSPDDTKLASSGSDGTIKIWDVKTGTELKTLHGHTSMVRCVKFSSDGKRLVSGSGDNTAKIWSAVTGEELLTLNGHSAAVVSASFDLSGQRILTGSFDEAARVWNATSGESIFEVDGFRVSGWNSVAFSPEGRHIAASVVKKVKKRFGFDSFYKIVLLESDSGKVIRDWDVGYTRTLAFDPSGKKLATSDGENVVIWETASGESLLTLSGHTNPVNCVAFSSDGKRIVTAGSMEDNTLKVWDALTGNELLELKGHQQGVLGVAFSKDGNRIASCGWDSTIRLWGTALEN